MEWPLGGSHACFRTADVLVHGGTAYTDRTHDPPAYRDRNPTAKDDVAPAGGLQAEQLTPWNSHPRQFVGRRPVGLMP